MNVLLSRTQCDCSPFYSLMPQVATKRYCSLNDNKKVFSAQMGIIKKEMFSNKNPSSREKRLVFNLYFIFRSNLVIEFSGKLMCWGSDQQLSVPGMANGTYYFTEVAFPVLLVKYCYPPTPEYF